MQITTQSQGTASPALAPPPPLTITTTGTDGKSQTIAVPHTEEEVRQLVAQREQLSDQLGSVTSRRHGLSQEIITAPEGASRTGLEARIRVLDQRILQLETDIASVGRQLALAPQDLVAGTESSPPPNTDEDTMEGFAMGVFASFLLAMAVVAYRRFRRKRRPAQRVDREDPSRLERLEHGVEAIAIEVERISEGQRFVTRLLSESQNPIGVANRLKEPVAETARSGSGSA